ENRTLCPFSPQKKKYEADSNTESQTQQEVQIATEGEPEDFSGETELESEGSEAEQGRKMRSRRVRLRMHPQVLEHQNTNSTDTVFDSPSGFKNWKKATYKEGGFAIHAKSERHTHAMIAWKDYQRAVTSNATLANVLNKEHNKLVQENREYIKTIAEVLLLTATQNIAQRGHNESAGSDNKGNFMTILETIANHDKAVKKRLTSIHNAKYTSKTIQNEVL
ncbi:hypothetical protein F7725_014390, partial [Dissostichus mawsoni]